MRYSVGVEKFKYSIEIKWVAVSRGVRGFTVKQTLHREVAKWLNAADCKSVPLGTLVRIQPSLPYVGIGEIANTVRCERIIQECKSLISTQIIYWAHLAAIK